MILNIAQYAMSKPAMWLDLHLGGGGLKELSLSRYERPNNMTLLSEWPASNNYLFVMAAWTRL